MAEGPDDRRVVAVLGYSTRRGGGIDPICASRLALGQELARESSAVILSGWARKPRTTAEAELMLAAWSGPQVPIVCDPDARSTAGNAANVVAAAEALGARELVVVTSSWHRRRARLLLRAALGRRPLRLTVVGADGPGAPTLVARELCCLLLLPLQLPRARRRATSRTRHGPSRRIRRPGQV